MTRKNKRLSKFTHKQFRKKLFIASTFLFLSLAAIFILRYSKNNLQGTWSSPYISQLLEKKLNQNLSKWAQDEQVNDYITDISTTVTISNAQGRFIVTCELDREALAKKLSQQSSQHQSISDWYQLVDQTLAKNVASLDGTYNPQSAQLTIPLFQTDLDPLFHNMSITKVNTPKVTNDQFQKGDTLTYEVVDHGQQLVFKSKHHEHSIVFNKE
ncbi:hypothetical protein [Streptococcus halotolerans]|uniref:hypothetical protein n=1 Tax=Streptococcus halotolerans TaxID=1814128 RepID=UPI000787391B|nr:hypothetical protein [Streptococcus halotolerans]